MGRHLERATAERTGAANQPRDSGTEAGFRIFNLLSHRIKGIVSWDDCLFSGPIKFDIYFSMITWGVLNVLVLGRFSNAKGVMFASTKLLLTLMHSQSSM
jgi:hypothetical protein